MPTYSLLKAKRISDSLLDRGINAELSQVSQHRFQIDSVFIPEVKSAKERFVFNFGWIPAKNISPRWLTFAILCLCSMVLTIGWVFAAQSENHQSYQEQASDPWLDETTISSNCIESLAAEATCSQRANSFSEVKRIELGGYLSILANQSLGEETKLTRLDLVKKQNGWELEKWVQLD